MFMDVVLRIYRFFRERPKLQLTLLFFSCFLAYGYILGLFGPSIPFLRENTQTMLEQQSFLVTVRAIGFFGGSGSVGFLVDKLPGNNVVAVVLLLGTVATIALPLLSSIYVEGIIMLIFGALMGSIDAGCNAMLVFLHGDDCDPYFHAMHLLFTSGAAISPLILEAVLASGLSFKYAWWIICAVMVTAALLLPTYESPKPPTAESAPVSPDPESASSEYLERTENSTILSFLDDPSQHRWWCAFVGSAFLLVYYGSEVATGSLLASYVQLQGLATTSQANLMTFSFWAAQSVGLAASIFISSRKTPPKFMLFGNVVFMGSGLLMFWIFRTSLTGSWIAAIVFGLGVSSGFPTMINLLQTYIDISGKISSLISVSSAVGEMIIPAFAGSHMENAGYQPSILILILGVGVFIQLLVYILLVLTGRPKDLSKDMEVESSPLAQPDTEVKQQTQNDVMLDNSRSVLW